MPNDHTYEPVEGEIMQDEPEQVDISSLAALNKSEISQQIATSKRYPRSVKKFKDEALNLATLDEATAGECIYALPRAGKVIEGPSARFAEILIYAWGNSRAGARVIGEDNDFVTSQGLFFDLEKNVAISYEVKRRITNAAGKRYSSDMIGTTSNAASSIALRNAVLKGIPKALWKPIYEAARKVVAGDFKTLVNRRESALQAFVIYGVTPDMIYKTLGLGGKDDIGIDHLVILNGFLNALKEGESSVQDIFENVENHVKSNKATAVTNEKIDKIAEKYAKKDETPAVTATNPEPQPEQSLFANLKQAAQAKANLDGEPVTFEFEGTSVTVDPHPVQETAQTQAPKDEGQAQLPSNKQGRPTSKKQSTEQSSVQGMPLGFDK